MCTILFIRETDFPLILSRDTEFDYLECKKSCNTVIPPENKGEPMCRLLKTTKG